MIRLDQSGVKASAEKCGRSEHRKNITEREKIRAKNKKEKRSGKIRAQSEKSSVDQSGESSVVQNNA